MRLWFRTFLSRNESHSAQTGALGSQIVFFLRAENMKVKGGVHFDQMIIFWENVAECRKTPYVISTFIEKPLIRSTGPKNNQWHHPLGSEKCYPLWISKKRKHSVQIFLRFGKSHSAEKILKGDPLVSPYFCKHENMLRS